MKPCLAIITHDHLRVLDISALEAFPFLPQCFHYTFGRMSAWCNSFISNCMHIPFFLTASHVSLASSFESLYHSILFVKSTTYQKHEPICLLNVCDIYTIHLCAWESTYHHCPVCSQVHRNNPVFEVEQTIFLIICHCCFSVPNFGCYLLGTQIFHPKKDSTWQ